MKTRSRSRWKLPGTLIRELHVRALRRKRVIAVICAIVIPVAIFSYLTNPFVKFSLVRDPYGELALVDGQFYVDERNAPNLKESRAFGWLAQVKSGWHIVSSRFSGGPKTKAVTVDDIIREIHGLRFQPSVPYLISGDHFSVLYPRSLGIFYHSLMDARTALDDLDWQNRQEIYLKTTAYALDVYAQSPKLSTTIVPIGPNSVALMNIYSYPSDTLYSLLYALRVMQDQRVLETLYPYEVVVPARTLQTASASAELVRLHKDDLRRHLETYTQDVYDQKTGLLRKDILLSGTKDITRRESAFYDNVIFWRTHQLAQELGIIEKDDAFLADLKARILSAYWLDSEGYFLEDLSEEGVAKKFYSSDWLIVQMTGFLSTFVPEERKYYEASVQYIQRNALDQPFGLQYHSDVRKHRLYGFVRVFAPSYGTTALWSNWGMEYAKTLLMLEQATNQRTYGEQAERQLEAYTFNIKRYRGYPELYDDKGDFYRQFFYKSVRRTGWIVTYEQARAMLRSLRQVERENE